MPAHSKIQGAVDKVMSKSLSVTTQKLKSKLATAKHGKNSHRVVLSDEMLDNDLVFELVEKTPGEIPKDEKSDSGNKLKIYSKELYENSGKKKLKVFRKFFLPEMTVRYVTLGGIGSVFEDYTSAPLESRKTGIKFQTDFAEDLDKHLNLDATMYDDINEEIAWTLGQLRKIEDKAYEFLWNHPFAFYHRKVKCMQEARTHVAASRNMKHYDLPKNDPEITRLVNEDGYKRFRTTQNFYPLITKNEDGTDKDTCPLLLEDATLCLGDLCDHEEHRAGAHVNYSIRADGYAFDQFHGKKYEENVKGSQTPYDLVEKEWAKENPTFSGEQEERQKAIDAFIVKYMAAKGIPFSPVHYKWSNTINRRFTTPEEKKRLDPDWYKDGPHPNPIGFGCVVKAGVSAIFQYNELLAAGFKLRLDKELVWIIKRIKTAKTYIEADEASKYYAEAPECFQSYEDMDATGEVTPYAPPTTSRSFLFGGGAATAKPSIDTPTHSRSAAYVPPEEKAAMSGESSASPGGSPVPSIAPTEPATPVSAKRKAPSGEDVPVGENMPPSKKARTE